MNWNCPLASMMMRLILVVSAASLGTSAYAQEYPNRPIRVIIPLAVGSITDVLMRATINEIQPRLGQPLTVENRGGAAGIIGGQACEQSPPDGYTICVVYHSTMSWNPLLFENLPYNPDNFAPIGRMYFLIEGIFASNNIGVKTISELQNLVSEKPDALNYPTLGPNSGPDLFLRWLNDRWGAKIVAIPYKGGGHAAQALAANDVQLARFGVGNFIGLVQGGKVQALAVDSKKRIAALPDVPTFLEAGLGHYPGQGWFGLVAPKGTPTAIVNKLSAEFGRLFAEPQFVDYLVKQAVEPAPTTPEGFAAFLKADRNDAETLMRAIKSGKEKFKPGN